MDQIKNILVPMDGSEGSRPVLSIGKQIAKKMDAHLLIISLLDESFLEKIKQIGSLSSTEVLTNKEKSLDEIIKEVGIKGSKYSAEVIQGVPFMEVISKAATLSADLIVLGGMESDDPHRLGNDSFKIMRVAPFNTLAIKIRDKDSFEEACVENILVALDFTKQSIMALDYAFLLKTIFDSKLRLLQVIPEKDAIDEAGAREKLKEYISAEQIEQIDSFDVKRSKNPAKTILNYVDESGIDLLAIGGQSKKRLLRNLFLGKISYDVVRKVSSSVIVVKDT